SATFGEGMKGMAPDIFLNMLNKSFTITAEVDVAANGNGVIVCQGGRFGGISFYVKSGKPAFTYNYLGLESFNVLSTQSLKPGKHTIAFDFKYDGGGRGKGGTGTITIDGAKAGEGRIEKTQPNIFSVDDLADVGIDEGTWVANYGSSAKFNGKLGKVNIQTNK
ncbi:MAG TPA: hypothetical protein VFD56_11020, partial [Chitinophagaceae bacterium]|nr:hypothetical protein [Chitinophagaceae bacterium]